MKFYDRLSRISFLSKYSYKFLFIAFLGIHIPLIGIIIFLITSQRATLSATTIILIALGLTLVATAISLYFLNKLLEPLTHSKNALELYSRYGTLPDLPLNYTDEAGFLMRQLQSTIVELDELIKSKDALVSLISHDIRKPLSHIISYAELAGSTTDPAKLDEYTSKIIASGNHQLDMLQQILKMLENHDIDLGSEHKKPVMITNMIREIEESFQDSLKEKSIKLEYDGTSQLSIPVHEELFGHVLNNLVSNAVKFSKENSVIRVSVSNSNGQCIIEVKDSGIGFEPGNSEAIFDRFTEKKQAGTHGEPSTGLGLYISRRIVEKHHGRLTASSDGKDCGAAFRISLPKQG